MDEFELTTIPLVATAYEQCVPLFTTIELTLKCNLRCVHCYNFDRSTPQPKESVAAELTPPEIYKLIDELVEAGGLEISFSGGEALLHPHLDDFIRYARARMFAVRIKSNGMLLTPSRVAKLVDAGAYAVDVSLYGATSATHDEFTTVKGSFDRTVAGIEAAVAADMKVSLSFCLTRGNAGEIAEMTALSERLGVTYTLDPQLTARYDGTTSSLDHRVDAETLEALYRGPLKEALGGPQCFPDRDVQCSCARTVCGINSAGEVYPCIGAPVPSGNLREQSFMDIWRHSPALNRIRGLTIDDFTDCKACPDRPFCRRSSGAVFTNTGNYTGAEPWTCDEAAIIHKLYDEAHAEGAPTEPTPTHGRLGKY
jgi:radical SAM protein with 4Fe4S-binding SPASM domain